jgi:hypothetical protein
VACFLRTLAFLGFAAPPSLPNNAAAAARSQPGAMPFRRYVSIGRVAYVNLAEDPLYGKLVVIVDVVDQNRVRDGAARRRAAGAGAAPPAARARAEQLRRAPCRARGATARGPPPALAQRSWAVKPQGFAPSRARRLSVLTPRAARCCAQALIDAPEITRTIINFKRLLLTDLTVDIGKIPNKKTLKEALAAAGARRGRLASRAACSRVATTGAAATPPARASAPPGCRPGGWHSARAAPSRACHAMPALRACNVADAATRSAPPALSTCLLAQTCTPSSRRAAGARSWHARASRRRRLTSSATRR